MSDGKLAALKKGNIYNVVEYDSIDDDKMKMLIMKSGDEAKQKEVTMKIGEVKEASTQGALANMCIFPIIMLVGYIALAIYFASRGGYKVQSLDDGQLAESGH